MEQIIYLLTPHAGGFCTIIWYYKQAKTFLATSSLDSCVPVACNVLCPALPSVGTRSGFTPLLWMASGVWYSFVGWRPLCIEPLFSFLYFSFFYIFFLNTAVKEWDRGRLVQLFDLTHNHTSLSLHIFYAITINKENNCRRLNNCILQECVLSRLLEERQHESSKTWKE